MSILNKLPKAFGVDKKRKRVGRGIGSGTGKTAGAGHKGQKARSGVAVKGFEGGQTPIFMRLPKRGFVSHFKKKNFELTLESLQLFIDAKRVDSKSQINLDVLKSAGIAKNELKLVVIGNSGLCDKIDIAAHRFSKGSNALIRSLGGSVNILEIS